MPQGRAQPVYVVVLTGGIASGKSTVSGEFTRLGVPVIDTDVIARDLVEPGTPLLASIVGAFGKELLDAYGRLKRRRLRQLIFTDEEKRRQLEALMHPEILDEARRQIGEVEAPYCVLVIPLLAEFGRGPGIDRVLVVDVPPEVQRERLTHRDRASKSEADAALRAQATRAERLAIADDLIDNSGSLAATLERVAELHRQYLALANAGLE